MSNGALCATSTAPRENSRKLGSTSSMGGAPMSIVVVMPVSTWMNGGHRTAGVHERLELAEHLAAAHLDRADLRDRAVRGRAARGLEVHDDERDVRQRGAQVVQGRLHRPRRRVRGGVRPDGAQAADGRHGGGRYPRPPTRPGSRPGASRPGHMSPHDGGGSIVSPDGARAAPPPPDRHRRRTGLGDPRGRDPRTHPPALTASSTGSTGRSERGVHA